MAVAPPSTYHSHLDPGDLRLTSRSSYGRKYQSTADPTYNHKDKSGDHVTRSGSCYRRDSSVEDSTNSSPAQAAEAEILRRSIHRKKKPEFRTRGRDSWKVAPRYRYPEQSPSREKFGYPLSEAIEKAKLPPNFRMPQCDLYDGTGDPGEHVYQFQTNMLLLQDSDAVMCRAFPTTLRKAAHAWFKSLQPRSIYSFGQLSDLFQKHFVSSRSRRKNSASLLNIVQEKNESLACFLRRFNAATLEIDNLDEFVKYTAFLQGLRPTSKFAFSVNKSPPGNMKALLEKANKYIQAEEYLETHRDRSGEVKSEQKKRSREVTPQEGKSAKRPKHQPLQKVLMSPEASGRLVNWSVELGEFDLQYKPRTAVKAQALADFIVECTLPEDPPQLVISEVTDPWNLYVDGSSAVGNSGAGIILISPEGFTIEYALRFRQGYYWPTMQKDAIEFTRRCDQCQKFAPLSYTPVAPLTSIVSPIPFAVWGMDLLGPFPMASGQRRFMIVAIDYFTKWTEAESLATITSAKCEDFFWKNIVCRFGVPRALVVDNGKQFDNNNFRTFCSNLSIDLRFTSVAHPQSNGQTENMNRNILQGLKKKLNEAKGAWVDELPKVLWAYRTTPHSITGETPFSLCYGTEAMLPVEIGVPTIRALHFQRIKQRCWTPHKS
ncbi:hypothetical protein RJ639_013522 [Escallonia herrerae]|uniref:Integrase catalytic domain-containing protein n=1 Tax=Escallonia herrerae TaxID=1293975 RepID=A0AA89ANI1_9ASTE|nr:hypothetical protein RJ639_013522 [Escallonia herrerae]